MSELRRFERWAAEGKPETEVIEKHFARQRIPVRVQAGGRQPDQHVGLGRILMQQRRKRGHHRVGIFHRERAG